MTLVSELGSPVKIHTTPLCSESIELVPCSGQPNPSPRTRLFSIDCNRPDRINKIEGKKQVESRRRNRTEPRNLIVTGRDEEYS